MCLAVPVYLSAVDANDAEEILEAFWTGFIDFFKMFYIFFFKGEE
jgi:hypothetical protein